MGAHDERQRQAPKPQSTESLSSMHRILSLAQQIAINDPSEIRIIGSVIQV